MDKRGQNNGYHYATDSQPPLSFNQHDLLSTPLNACTMLSTISQM
jgi:hypothetical protein